MPTLGRGVNRFRIFAVLDFHSGGTCVPLTLCHIAEEWNLHV